MSKERVTCEMLRVGQPKPYADSEYVGRLTIEWQGMEGYKNKDAPFIPRAIKANDKYYQMHVDNIVKPLIKTFIRPFNESKNRNWFEGYLEYVKMVGPGVWEACVIEKYTD